MNSIDTLLNSSFGQSTIQVDGTTFLIKEMDAGSADKYQSGLYVIDGKGGVKYNTKEAKTKLVFLCLHDEQGNRVFTKDADMALIKRMPSSLVDKIFNEATKVNNLEPEEKEETEKN